MKSHNHAKTILLSRLVLLFICSCSLSIYANETPGSYTLFESGQVRPLALSPHGKLLFAANTPDNRLEVFSVQNKGLKHCGSVSVGLEPVAIGVRNNHEVWVVNHLSDSVSIVKIPDNACKDNIVPGRVIKTLQVGDEPRDIVFAGGNHQRAFITTAHRGQHLPFDPQLTTPGIGRADVWVFEAEQNNKSAETPSTIITLFTDTPRALTVSADGKRVYAAGFHTGNRTTTIFEHNVTAGGGLPAPVTDSSGEPQPTTGLIVKYDGQHWRDELGRVWDDHVKFSLPDKDVFVIDALANPPAEMSGMAYKSVGSTLFNMITNPVSGVVYVSNTDAANDTRFEGPGIFTGSSTRGNLHQSRITILKNGVVTPRHLNKHIDYSQCCDAVPNPENSRSLAFPVDMAISRNGKTLYVAAFGSSKIGIFDTHKLENDSFTPDENNHIEVSGGGPSGIVLDEKHNRLYVLTRFDNSVSVLDVAKRQEVDHINMYNPEPEHIVKGRRFLYDARFTSSHGDSACASCHVFGDFDALSWDLGNPDATTTTNTSPLVVHPAMVGFDQVPVDFRAMKGPMSTQSLRGLANHGSQHWRGDRNAGHIGEPNEQPDSGVYNEEEAFRQFNPAFVGLVGRHAPLSTEDMQAFTDFALELTYPPNPNRALDNSLTADQQAGSDFFFGMSTTFGLSDPFNACSGCHVTDPLGNAEFGVKKPGFFGADGRATFELGSQVFKIPHLRNLYQKVGMFGMSKTPGGFIIPESSDPDSENAHTGDQVRGFGFFHDGSIDTIFRFLKIIVFQHAEGGPFPNPGGFTIGPDGDEQRRQAEQFVLAFPSNMYPVVGQQVTVNKHNINDTLSRLQLLLSRADAGECDLIAKQTKNKREGGFLYKDGEFIPDTIHSPPRSPLQLIDSVDKGMTFTCTPPGAGIRMGIDRNEDGVLDGDRPGRKDT